MIYREPEEIKNILFPLTLPSKAKRSGIQKKNNFRYINDTTF